MSRTPLITVIVPVYNILDYLPRCVYSITAQTYGNLEIILVDDGSTDGTGELCDRLAQEDGRISVYHKENGGSSSARNLALEMHPWETAHAVSAWCRKSSRPYGAAAPSKNRCCL